MRANRQPTEDGRIVGGVEARPGSNPWIVSLQNYGMHFCGGTLIRVNNKDESDIVITAAHCVPDGFNGDIVFGAHNLARAQPGQMTVPATRAVPHPEYNPDTTLNDIAVVKLSKPIKFTKTIQPACLPAKGEIVPDTAQGTVAGWGHTQEGAYDTSKILMQVGVPVVSSDKCINNYRQIYMTISKREMLCAGYSAGGKDACQGDSGGPLVFAGKDGYVLQGVVSFGEGCAREDKPGVYSRVSNYIDWIQRQVKILSSVN
jgi:transmembrane serine protease 3